MGKIRIAVAGAGLIGHRMIHEVHNLRITEAIVEAARTGRIVNTEAHTH